MSIIKQYHKDTNTTYVYESVSYWDAEKQQSRSNRKLLGKLDPQTGEIIPTGGRGRKKKEAPFSSADPETVVRIEELEEKLKQYSLIISQQKQQISALEEKNRKLIDILGKIRRETDTWQEIVLCSEKEG